MFRWFCLFMFRITGWKLDTFRPPQLKRSIVIAAPHTSNWDFWYAIAAFAIYKLPVRFGIKKEWMRFPAGLLIKALGGIGIDRNPKKAGEQRLSQTEALTELFENNKDLVLLLTPEGTRSKSEHWKTGFYHVAVQANVPILLGYIDYEKKIAGIGKVIYPTDMEKDMREIMAFYQQFHARYPEKFSVDVDYLPPGYQKSE